MHTTDQAAPSQADALFNEGLDAHRRGDLGAAMDLYEQALRHEPGHFDALHHVGIAAYHTGNHDVALQFIGAAIERNGAVSSAYGNLGNVYQARQQLAPALACYDQALLLDVGNADAHYNRGNVLRRLGRFEEALDSYDHALRLHAGDAQAWNNRAVVLQDLKRYDEALASADQALALAPALAAAHNNRGNSLASMQRHDEALLSFEAAIALQPRYAEAWSNMAHTQFGLDSHEAALATYAHALALDASVPETHKRQADLLATLGRSDEAQAAYERATTLKPHYADAYMARRALLLQLGRTEEALECFQAALALEPDNRQAQFQRGLALRELKRLDAALPCFDKAIALDEDADAHILRGQTLLLLDRADEAVGAYARALELEPDHYDAHIGYGNALQRQRRRDEAAAAYSRAIALRPDGPDGHLNLGNIRQDMNDLEGALACYATVIELCPDDPMVYNNRGNLHEAMMQFDAAMRDYDRAIELKPDFVTAHWNKALMCMRQGELEAGLSGFEWRWKAEHLAVFRENRDFDQPLWLGQQDLKGKTILLYAEQGLGDTLQFCRYVPMVAARGATVILEVQAPLVKLLQSLPGAGQILAQGAELPAFDFHCPLLSLPLAFKTTLATIPAPPAYLAAEPAGEQAWRARLGPTGKLRVGLAWSGNPVHKNDHNRSIAFEQFAAVLSPHCEFVSLQKEHRTSDAARLAASPVRDLSAQLNDFVDTAALCASLDLVIAVDTSIAHLAGALGKPVWILVPEASDWRWLLERSDSPWYPSARLYRQQSGEDWSAALARVRADLDALAGVNADTGPQAGRLFAQGLGWHQQGLLEQALAAYEQVVQLQPGHFDALHHIGILAWQAGAYGMAEQFLQAALAVDAQVSSAHGNLGNVLKAAGRHEDALASYARALALDEANADAHYNRANTLRALGRFEEALAGYDRAVALQPDDAQAWNNRAVVLETLGRYDAALDSLDAVLARNPAHAEAHDNRGNVLARLGRFEEALASHARALALDDSNANAHYNLGNTLLELGRHEAALASYDRALALQAGDAQMWNNRAVALEALGRFEQALDSLDAALTRNPAHAEAHNNRGNVLARLRRQQAALDSFARALACRPHYAGAFVNRSKVLKELGLLDAAQADLERAIALEPELADARLNLGLLALLRGRLAQGWQGFESRGKAERRRFDRPLWLGEEPLAGRTILLWAEQGLGDTLQFCRYVEHVAARGASVILEVQAPLVELLRSLPGVTRVLARGDALPGFDLHCPLLSLPLAFGTKLATIPASPAYLAADPAREQAWRDRLGPAGKLRVGLAWSGNPVHQNDHNRSIAFEQFARLLGPHCEFVSLQKEYRDDDAAALEHSPVRDFSAHLADFSDTAALCASLDLIITVDTSIAHLAGALGKPVWILLSDAVDWRWLLERSDSPWYPSARLVRQHIGGDWSAVLARVRTDLDALAGVSAETDSPAQRLFAQGLDLHRQGQLAQALAVYEQALRLQPGYFDVLHHVGILAWQTGDHGTAEQLLRAALAVDAQVSSAHSNLGNVLKASGRLDAALASYARALALDDGNADAHYNRANTLRALGRFDEALAAYERAIALQPGDAQALNNRAVVLEELGRYEAALDSLDAALTRDPAHAEAHNNRGNVLARQRRREAALDSFARALACRPDYSEAFVNRAKVLKDLGQLDAAQADLEHAIALEPELADAHWNLALLALLRGRLAQGWQGHEWRWKVEQLMLGRERRRFDRPLWLGEEPLAGRTILLWAEQGLGDTLQFCRYAEHVAAQGATVILEVQAPLAGLLAGLAHRVIARGEALPAFDLHCPLMSLPLAFGTELATIPWQGPYLHADSERVAQWGQRLGRAGKLRVGLAWSGNPKHKNDHNRSIAFEQFTTMLGPDCEFISLQKEYRDGDAAALENSPVRDLSTHLADFGDTAALCATLDLVIAVDTSIAHLAGALGKPVWILLPDTVDWRWLLERSDSPWYPDARLYRQHIGEDWSAVLARVRTDLDALAGANSPIDPQADALFAHGLDWHRQGQLEQALAAYEQALQLQPGHGGVLYHIGMVAHDSGDHASAEQFFYAALEADSGVAMVWNALGNTMKARGRHEAAVASYTQALACDSGHAEAYYNRGNALQALGRFEEALASYDSAIALDAKLAQAWNNRAVALQQLGRLDDALASLDAVLALQPEHAEAYNNRGNVLTRQHRSVAALASFEQALAYRPDYADALVNRATPLQELGRFEQALDSLDAALTRNPAHAEAHNNRGNVLARQRRREAALDSFARALACRPDYSEAFVNRAKVLKDLGQLDAAQADLEHAIALEPELADAHWNLALLALLRGRLAQGWQGHEWRWKVEQLMLGRERRRFDRPLWLGEEPLAGRTILLWAEQGLGDTLQFCRYAEHVAAQGATVILEVQAPLAGLLAGLAHRVIARGEALPAFDLHCPLMSLPLAFGTELATIPWQGPYLHADSERVAQWGQRLGRAGKLRVGLAWSGNPKHKNDHNRSIAFEQFTTMLGPDCEFISLQKEYRDGDAAALENSPVRDLSTHLADFGDTAALCATLDLVIAVDTSIAHLAGALGKPVWILLPDTVDWRWLLERSDSPWYPDARLYRQHIGEDWSAVLARVRTDLATLASA
jgi:tetratricopeptide (TPR) repeat protein